MHKRITGQQLASYAALCLAGLVAAVCLGNGGFSAWGPDTCGYVSAGHLWRHNDLYRPQPLPLWASWPHALESASPLAYRAGPIRGTEVSIYPLGFPVLIGAATRIGGPLASYVVAPFMAAVLVWCAFALGRRVDSLWAGLLAATLTASSPIVLLNSVHPMSDVPAAALWTAAWLVALGGTTSAGVASGLLAALAILVRPNLAPLVLVVGGTLMASHTANGVQSRPWRWRAFIVCCATASVGLLLVLWSQTVLYGGPLTPSYPGSDVFFRVAHVKTNVQMYPRLLASTHTLLPLAGLILVGLALFDARRVPGPQARVIVLGAGALIFLNVVLYLPYLPFDHWPFLRFLLPALAALFVLFSSGLVYLTRFVWVRWRWVAVAVPLMAAIVVAKGVPLSNYALEEWRAQARVRLMGLYLREALPANAAVLSFFHSCAVTHYADRQVVRADLLEPATFDDIVDKLTRRGYRPVFVMDQELEERQFRALFAQSRYGRLDWPPRAVFTSISSILYFDVADQARFQKGERWAVDVLR